MWSEPAAAQHVVAAGGTIVHRVGVANEAAATLLAVQIVVAARRGCGHVPRVPKQRRIGIVREHVVVAAMRVVVHDNCITEQEGPDATTEQPVVASLRLAEHPTRVAAQVIAVELVVPALREVLEVESVTIGLDVLQILAGCAGYLDPVVAALALSAERVGIAKDDTVATGGDVVVAALSKPK